MHIALMGHASVGKTTLAALLARSMAGTGVDVLAVDSAYTPRLGAMLGLRALGTVAAAAQHAAAGATVATAANSGGRYGMRPVSRAADLFGAFEQSGQGQLRVLELHRPHEGDSPAGCACDADAAERLRAGLAAAHQAHLVIDLDRGQAAAQRGDAEQADVWLVVLEPYYRSLDAAARLVDLARERGVERCLAVANKLRDADDRAAIEAYCTRHGIAIAAHVPFDPAVASAAQDGAALSADEPAGTALTAMRECADRLGLVRDGVAA